MPVSVLAVLGRGLVDPDTPILRGDDLGVTRGDGCFEGCRVLVSDDGTAAVAKLDAHLDRMARSADALALDFDRAAWLRLVAEACSAWAGSPEREAGMKLVLTRGTGDGSEPTGYLTISPLPADYPRQRRDGLTVITLDRGFDADSFAGTPWLLGGVKTLSYAVNMAAQREAARRGADDALFVTHDGHVLESPTGTVVWLADGTLHTTPLEGTGILGGTTQQLLFERAASAGFDTASTLATVDDLHAAELVWLIGSVRGPVDVVELDGKARVRNPEIDRTVRALCGF